MKRPQAVFARTREYDSTREIPSSTLGGGILFCDLYVKMGFVLTSEKIMQDYLAGNICLSLCSE